jgi:hypothetical protein
MSTRRIIGPGLIAILLAVALSGSGALAASSVYRIDRVTDGDTVVLRNGQRVRLVQIDTPEVFFGVECYGRAASLRTKTLLPRGTRVRLMREPASDRVDRYGRLLRLCHPCARRGERESPPRCCRRGRALLLPARERQVREDAGGSGQTGPGKEARPLACLSSHSLQPL